MLLLTYTVVVNYDSVLITVVKYGRLYSRTVPYAVWLQPYDSTGTFYGRSVAAIRIIYDMVRHIIIHMAGHNGYHKYFG